MKKVRIGVVGLKGVNSLLYLKVLKSLKNIELVCGCDVQTHIFEEFEKLYGIRCYSFLTEMLHNESIDGVFIGTPNQFHLQSIEEAAENKINVFVTKPIANTVAESKKAIEICKKNKVILQIGHEHRFRPGYRTAIEHIKNGKIGQLSATQMHYGHLGGMNMLTAKGTWRANADNAPGGTMNLVAIHCFDTLNSLMGRPISVTCYAKHLYAQVDIWDTSATIIEYEQGYGLASSSYCSESSEWMRAYGTEANIKVDNGFVHLEKDGGQKELCVDTQKSSAKIMVEQFENALMKGILPDTSGEDGLLAVAVLEASIISAKEGRKIFLNELL